MQQIKLAGAIALLKRPKQDGKSKDTSTERHLHADALISRIASLKLLDRIYELDVEKKECNQLIRQLQQSEETARELSGIEINLDRLRSDVLAFKAYSAPDRKTIKSLGEEIDRKRLPVELLESDDKGNSSLFVAYQKGFGIEEIARRYNLREIDFSLNRIHGKPADALREITDELSAAHKRIKVIDDELAAISGSDYRKLSALVEMLEIELTKARVSEIFKKTDRTIIIEGWIPQKRAKDLERVVSRACENRHYIEGLEDGELAPTLTNRPKMLQPFDYMIGFISVPRSDELDPAVPFMLSFPIFYGLMISDVGYGILSFFFAWYLTKITDPEGLVHNVSKIWQLSAVSAMFFGFLSNQYFGLQLNQYFTTFVGFDWFKNLPAILLISIIFGIIQVVIGLAFGFINKYKHHRKVAFGRLFSIFLVLSGTVAIAGGLFNVFSSTITIIAGGIAIASLIAVLVLSGEEAGEVTNLISHPLSYARIMGFGLASVVLALIIDKAFTPNLSGGIVWFVVSLVFFLALHFMNMIVSMFEGAVQGARLNFIEFFTKFYTGGGIRFKPFGSKRVYTKD